MKNVKIKEIIVTNIDELSEIIRKTIMQCKDTQIFISNSLFNRLLKEDKSRIIWEERVFDSFHYADGVEKAFIFEIKDRNGAKTSQMHIVANSSDYMQLTFFATKGTIYHHYFNAMNIILIINTD